MIRNEDFLDFYSNDSRRSHPLEPSVKPVLLKRARNEVAEEEAVIQSMVKRLRVDDDSKPPSPVFQQYEQQHQHQPPQFYQTQQPHHCHHQQQQQQHFFNQHNHCSSPLAPLHSAPQAYQAKLTTFTEIAPHQEQFPLTPQGRRQQQFHRQQQHEFQQEQQHLQVPGDESEELPFVSPMNKLLGSLHQQRRVAPWQRQERLLLPTNTQLF